MKPPKLLSLQTLRFYAFSIVFCWHSGFSVADGNALHIFFMLSGFVMAYRLAFVPPKRVTLRGSFAFARQRVRLRYPLHVVLLAAALALRMLYFWKKGVPLAASPLQFAAQLAANLLLVQSWVPLSSFYYSFNGVAWFLSCMVFLYFATPLLLAALRRLPGKWWMLAAGCGGLLAYQAVSDALAAGAVPSEYYVSSPLLALLLYIGGLGFGAFHAHCLRQLGFAAAHTARAVFSTLTVVLYAVTNWTPWRLPVYGENWLLIGLLILGLAQECGPACALAHNPVTVHLGDIGFELYMVHQVLFSYVDAAVEYLWRYQIYITSVPRHILQIVLTLALAELAHLLQPRITRLLLR